MDEIVQESDIKVEFFRSSGPGGQHKNVTDSAVRIRHLPTGIVVSATESRSQARNRDVAMERLADALRKRNRKVKKRIPTKATKSSIEKRLTEKKRRAEKKRSRSAPDD